MSQTKALLDGLKAREESIFPEDFAKSGLTAKDITVIGKELKVKFPASFKTFLRTYQMPSTKVYICLCGDTYTNSFGITFSRTENKYIDTEEDRIIVELDWFNYDVSGIDAFIKSFHERNDGTAAWAKAGFILLGEFRGYKIFLDGKEDVVYSIYHEDLYESEDYDDPKAARECMEENAHEFCDNFEQFLKVICTGKPFDEDDHVLLGDEKEEEPAEQSQEGSAAYIIRRGEPSDTPIQNQDKIGGYPTYLPEYIPEIKLSCGYFLMEIYNHGFADPDILCWQVYCAEKTANTISDIIEIRKGAPLYDVSSKLIKKRRWIHEYPLFLDPCDPKKIDERTSAIGGKVPKLAKNSFKRKKITYLGTIRGTLVPNTELAIGYTSSGEDDGILAMGFDEKGKLCVEPFC